MVVRHVSVSRLLGRTACGLTCLSNRLTRQAGKLVRALQAGAQAIGIVCHDPPTSRDLQLSRHGRLYSSLRVTAGLVFLAQLFAQPPLKNTSQRRHDDLTLSIYK
jgi:hypothetical protein